MFNQNYHSEKPIKRIALIVMISGLFLAGLAILASLILLCVRASYLWWISLIVLGSGLVYLLLSYVTANLLWGFAEIVGNSNRISMSAKADAAEDAPLPEL